MLKRLDALEITTKSLTTDMAGQSTSDTKLDGRITVLETEQVKTESELTTTLTLQKNMNIHIGTIQSDFDGLEGLFGDHEGKANDLEDRLETIEENLAACNSRIDDVDVNLQKHSAGTGAQNARLDDSWEKESDINELMLDWSAASLSKCGEHCAECRTGYYSDYPAYAIYQCIDEGHYIYQEKCADTDDKSKCATGSTEYCHWSFP